MTLFKSKKSMAILLLMCAIIGAMLFGMQSAGSRKSKAEQMLAEGNRYLTDLEYTEAIASFQNALSVDPKSEIALRNLADCYVNLAADMVDVEIISDSPENYSEEEYQEVVSLLQSGITYANENPSLAENPAYDDYMTRLNETVKIYAEADEERQAVEERRKAEEEARIKAEEEAKKAEEEQKAKEEQEKKEKEEQAKKVEEKTAEEEREDVAATPEPVTEPVPEPTVIQEETPTPEISEAIPTDSYPYGCQIGVDSLAQIEAKLAANGFSFLGTDAGEGWADWVYGNGSIYIYVEAFDAYVFQANPASVYPRGMEADSVFVVDHLGMRTYQEYRQSVGE